MEINQIYNMDCIEGLKLLKDASINCIVTSPPYWGLRNYGEDKQIGQEKTLDLYLQHLNNVFTECYRVLMSDGTMWLNIGDCYAGSNKGAWNNPSDSVKNSYTPSIEESKSIESIPQGLKRKDLVMLPFRVALMLQEAGWYVRSDIIWHKPNSMPESVRDRPTRSHEYVFLLSKSDKYYYDYEAVKESTETFDNSIRDRDNSKLNNTPGRSRMGGLKTNNYKFKNKRSVWSVSTRPSRHIHFAVFPEKLIEPCILAGSRINDVVLDPFMGSGTTAVVATKYKRNYIGFEINNDYIDIAKRRIANTQMRLIV